MNLRTREQFDQHLEHVLSNLPATAHQILEEVPLIVEDYPSDELMREMEVAQRDELCGLYDGVPLSQPEDRHARAHPDGIMIFREGVIASARDARGKVTTLELRRQIRITILHEIGHHFGMTEDELDELGYG